ncbi:MULTISPECIES: hypothetical protein [Burkholderia cepacia complex]|uniref:hypothetical protein n=1 Tax=Burkholderia cepacia complex TaxID=87882 RepID=UPI00073ACFDF|nr:MULTISPECIES: hypothetical protein [Burkholderia cepacia complex]ALV60158.1 membrane protein [Burkholderia cenocepacia]AQQ21344.1 hypothetical protein A8D61_24330 [Burkholderia cenocepacia]AQQ47069.1 hypothetical protein A8F32_14995 [Burkholderia cenocepacia]MCA8212645.1 hypothetical protein [Burkholderia cepacia]MCW3687673.1 hypothetical protein [Burkholderia cenocepacia]
MEIKFYLYCLADLTLIATSLICGVKYLVKRNGLLGFESLVVTFSATNLMINALTGNPAFFEVSIFCDAFSRGFGVPVITIAAMMAVTHRYKPSILGDVMYVVGALAGTVVLWAADFMIGPKPYFYLAMWSLFSLYLVYVIKKLIDAGENRNAASVTLALVSTQIIASIYDFYHIPGDSDHMIFYTLAMFSWSYMSVSLYFAYCALERAQEDEIKINRRYAVGTMHRHQN